MRDANAHSHDSTRYVFIPTFGLCLVRRVTTWSQHDIDYLQAHHSDQSDDVIASKLSKTASAVRHKRSRFHLSACRRKRTDAWSESDDEFLTTHHKMRNKEIGDRIGRSPSAVSHRKKHLGLRKSQSEVAWSPAEDQILHQNALEPLNTLVTKLNRTPVAIRQRRRHLGLTRPKDPYVPTASEMHALLEHLDDPEPMKALRAKIPGATDAQIWRQLRRLGRRRQRRSGYTIMNRHRYKTVGGKLVAEHRLVAQSMLGRRLEKVEVVHHIDCNPINNDPTNLDVLSDSSVHAKAHASLDRVISRLVRASVVVYDKESNKYGVLP